ncbi:hypothetical protein HCN44_003351 [Aphidius gifuensis]|uniref:Uncharacterized protein n=1 Tax=Aphidius gifuensis TaxID=684658 RepID=A0A834Y0G7_APHGI|nr:uncharacterized protein LOC122849509 [Aphidius gifuensis]KAF7994261.1 hypothetical protein HCN44_003351 [Aphidius gifuensis]
MNRVVDKIVESQLKKYKIKCNDIKKCKKNESKKQQNRCSCDSHDKSQEAVLDEQHKQNINFRFYNGLISHSPSIPTEDSKVESKEFVDKDQNEYDDSHIYNDDYPAGSSISNLLEAPTNNYRELDEFDEETDQSSRQFLVSSPLRQGMITQPSWTLDGSDDTSTLDNNNTNREVIEIIRNIQSLRNSIVQEMTHVLSPDDSTESRSLDFNENDGSIDGSLLPSDSECLSFHSTEEPVLGHPREYQSKLHEIKKSTLHIINNNKKRETNDQKLKNNKLLRL